MHFYTSRFGCPRDERCLQEARGWDATHVATPKPTPKIWGGGGKAVNKAVWIWHSEEQLKFQPLKYNEIKEMKVQLSALTPEFI